MSTRASTISGRILRAAPLTLSAALSLLACGGPEPATPKPEPSAAPLASTAPVVPTTTAPVPPEPAHCALKKKAIDAVAWSPDGATLVTAGASSGTSDDPSKPSKDGSFDVWNATTGAHVTTLDGGGSRRGTRPLLVWSKDGKTLVSGGDVENLVDWLTYWDTRTWTPHHVGSRSFPANVVVSADGRRAAMIGGAGMLAVVDLASGQVLDSTPYTDGHGEYRVALSSDGETLLLAGPAPSIGLRKVGAKKEIVSLDIVCTAMTEIPLSPKQDLLAAISERSASLLDARTGRRVRALAQARLPKAAERVASNVAWSPDGSRLALVTDTDVQIWDAATGRRLGSAMRAPGAVFGAAVDWSPDAKYLVVGSEILDAAVAGRVAKLPKDATPEAPNPLAGWSGDHEMMVVSGATLSFIDAATGQKTRAELALGKEPERITIRPDRRVIATVADGNVRIVRLRDGARAELGVLLVDGRAEGLAWRADGAFEGPEGAAGCLGPGLGGPAHKASGVLGEVLRIE